MALDTEKTEKTYRLQVRFWLDLFRNEEYELAQYVDELKEKRSFASTIRDALRLMRDLKNGRVDTLIQMFPWIADHFKPPVLDDPLREQIQQLTALMAISSEEAPAPPRPLGLPAPKPKTYAEPELVISQAAPNRDINPSANLRIQAVQMMGEQWQILNDSDLAYGIRTGRIPKSAEQFIRAKPTGGNPKKMDVPQFQAPDFEDLTL